MNGRQKLFVDEYLVDLNAEAAARRAGYGSSKGYTHGARMLKRSPKVAQAVAERMRERSERMRITADYVLAQLREVVDRCMEEENFNPAGACKALELLGRHLGMFTDRVKAEISGPGGGPLQAAVVTVNLVRPAPARSVGDALPMPGGNALPPPAEDGAAEEAAATAEALPAPSAACAPAGRSGDDGGMRQGGDV